MYTSNIMKTTTRKKLVKELSSGTNELVGLSYNSLEFPTGVISEIFLTDLEYVEGEKLNFRGNIFINDSQLNSIKLFNDLFLEASGLGYIETESLDETLVGKNALSDFILKGTNLSSTKKIGIVSTFVEPNVEYTVITIAGVKFKLFKISEEYSGMGHTVYLLLTEKLYDGQTFLGTLNHTLAGRNMNKGDLTKIIELMSGANILGIEYAGATLEGEDIRAQVFNTNKEGIFHGLDSDRYTVISGQSILSVNLRNTAKVKLNKVNSKRYTLTMDTRSGHLTIFL